ncbi:MAG: transglutaminase domain-containing protein [Candidatus Aminicenantes bacterium]|nr:transglutaminase domain-containing protein [Candidatus Aminicenantes bacterium]
MSLNFLIEKYGKSPISSRKYAILLNGFKIGEEKVDNFSSYFRFKKVIKTKREIVTSIRKKEDISKMYESYLFIESLTGKPIFFSSKRIHGYQDEIETSGRVKNGFILLKKDDDSLKKIETRELFLFPSYVENQMKREGLKIGSKYNLKVFEPSLETIIDLFIDVKSLDNKVINKKIYKLFKVEGTYYYPNMKIKFYAWLNRNGTTYKVIYPSMKMEKILVALLHEIQIPEVADLSYSVPISENITYNPRYIKELEIKIENENIVELKKELKSSSSIQRIIEVGNNFIILSIKSKEYSQANLFPYSISELNNKEERYLKHTVYTQSNDSEIKSLANKIVKNEKNLLRILRKINAFVFECLSLNLEKNIKIGLARPKEILSLKSGDCTEYAVLFASLARALGIPSRVVGGVVYDGKYFAYHMWVQVWCKEWIDVDPAFQQIGVDATHIAFASSDLSEKSITEMGLILTHFISKTNYHILKIGI